jgi:hypothetical protein
MLELYLHSPYVFMAWSLIDEGKGTFQEPCVPYETSQILSEVFPDAMDNKGVTSIRDGNVKWFTLYVV